MKLVDLEPVKTIQKLKTHSNLEKVSNKQAVEAVKLS